MDTLPIHWVSVASLRASLLTCCLVIQSAAIARDYFKDAPNVTVVEMDIDDGWTRDWGPSVSTLIAASKLMI